MSDYQIEERIPARGEKNGKPFKVYYVQSKKKITLEELDKFCTNISKYLSKDKKYEGYKMSVLTFYDDLPRLSKRFEIGKNIITARLQDSDMYEIPTKYLNIEAINYFHIYLEYMPNGGGFDDVNNDCLYICIKRGIGYD